MREIAQTGFFEVLSQASFADIWAQKEARPLHIHHVNKSIKTGDVMKILIGVDGSEYSDAALDEVSRRTWPAGSQILVVNAYELPITPTTEVWLIPPDYYERLDQSLRRQCGAILEAAVKKLESRLADDVEITSKAVLGSPKRAIVDEAETFKADLIVVGSHGYPAWERLLLGSVSQAVVSHAKCSVEVVRLPHAKRLAA
jgi:nucleotide-binding universal stress UspA family protein